MEAKGTAAFGAVLAVAVAITACGTGDGGASVSAKPETLATTNAAITAATADGGDDASASASSDATSGCSSTHSPQIAPDQEDYFAPTTVHLNATGLECGASYSVQITTPNETWPQSVPSSVVDLAPQTADGTGATSFSYDLTTEENGVFDVELLDSTGNVVATTDFHDSHFRYGHVTWVQSGPPSNHTAVFTVNDAWRISYPWNCYATSGAQIACTGPAGAPTVGNIIGAQTQNFYFGDGASVPIYYVVTGTSPASDWLVGRGIATPADAAKQTITHTYAASGPYAAYVDGCCRLSTLNNGANGNFHVGTTVRFDVVDSSPVSSLLPIVFAPVNATDFHFTLPTVDTDGDAITCRLATCVEAYDTSCTFPPNMTVGSDCTVHWNTVGLASGQVYTTQVHISGARNGTPIDDVAVDFLLQLVQADANPPQCALSQLSPTPTTNTSSTAAWSIAAGTTLSFRVTGTDPDTGDTVTINASSPPAGSSLTPALPVSGASPESTSFSWVPALSDVGSSKAVTFIVTDQVNQQAQCSVTVEVVSPCPEGNACDDGNACTTGDTCHNNACAGTPVVCTASDQCHSAGTCDPSSGACTNPVLANGTSCNDGNACTQSDTCQAGVCTGANPVVCAASDQCHVAGTCDPSSGACSNPAAANGTTCNDGNACTQTDSCESGSCAGSNPVVCTASDACHLAGTCDPSSGTCSNPSAPPQLNPGTNQSVVGSCSSTPVSYTQPTVVDGCTATVTCTPVPGNSYGDHTVTCTATGPTGETSAPVSFTVTVLQPLTIEIQPPLYGNNDTVDNIAKAGSTVPTMVALYACGTNVTETASVAATLAVTYEPGNGSPGTPVVVAYNGMGGPGGAMVFDGTYYHYNLDTKGYAVTAGVPSFFQLNVTVAYPSAPSVVVGSDAIELDTK